MATTTIDEEKLKDLVKTALVEVLETRRELMLEIVEEAMEDFAFSRAIEQGILTKTVSREEIFAVLEEAK